MSEGSDQDRGYSEEDDAGKQRVKRSEEFRPVSMQNIHRTHSREDHGSIQERIYPIEPAQVMVTRDAKAQAKDENTQRKRRVASDTPHKRGSTQKMVRSMFVHKSSGGEVSLILPYTRNGN